MCQASRAHQRQCEGFADEGDQQVQKMRRDRDRRLTPRRTSSLVSDNLFKSVQTTVRADLDALQRRHVRAGQQQRPPQERCEAFGAGEFGQNNPQFLNHHYRFMDVRIRGGLACSQ
jgi:hypothetical protein